MANRCKNFPITPFQLVVVHSGKSGNKESRHYDLYCVFASKLSVDKIDDINANSFAVGLQSITESGNDVILIGIGRCV